MPRIRTLKPELPSDAKLARVCREARYTFVLLITQADDEGLVPAAHRQLLGSLYPHDDDVTVPILLGWLEELVSIGALRWRSTIDGSPVLELVNWTKHQRVDNKGKSLIAANLVDFAETRREPPRLAESRGLDLGPRTLDLGARGPSPRKSAAGAYHPVFLECCEIYPEREGNSARHDGSKAFNARLREQEDLDALRGGTRRYREYCERKGWIGTGYVMQMSRFYGPSKQYLESWECAISPEESALNALRARQDEDERRLDAELRTLHVN